MTFFCSSSLKFQVKKKLGYGTWNKYRIFEQTRFLIIFSSLEKLRWPQVLTFSELWQNMYMKMLLLKKLGCAGESLDKHAWCLYDKSNCTALESGCNRCPSDKKKQYLGVCDRSEDIPAFHNFVHYFPLWFQSFCHIPELKWADYGNYLIGKRAQSGTYL